MLAPGTAQSFPEDEPLFAKNESEAEPQVTAMAENPSADDRSEGKEDVGLEGPKGEAHHRANPNVQRFEVESSEWDREQKRLHEANVASVFGEPASSEKTFAEKSAGHVSTASERERDKEDEQLDASDVATARESSGGAIDSGSFASDSDRKPSGFDQAASAAGFPGTM